MRSGGRGVPRRRRLAALEPWLVLALGPALVFPELFPRWVEGVALVGLLAVWPLRRWIKGRWGRRTPLDIPIALLLLTLPGAVTAARDLVAAATRVESLLFAIALYYAIVNAVRWPRHAWSTTGWLLISGIALSVVGLFTVNWLDKYPLLSPMIRSLPSLGRPMPHPTIEAGVHPNELAGLLVLFIPLALALAAWDRPRLGEAPTVAPGPSRARRRRSEVHPGSEELESTPAPSGSGRTRLEMGPPPHLRALAVLCLLTCLPVLALTQSRGAWLALAAALIGMATVYVWSHRRRVSGEALVVVGGLVLVLLALALPMAAYAASVLTGDEAASGLAGTGRWIAGRIAAGRGIEGLSAEGRLSLWREAIAMIRDRPLTGIGLNTFPLVHGDRPGGFVYQGLPHAHNTLLQAGIDYGVVGMVAVALLMVAVFHATRRAYRRLHETAMEPLVVGLAFGLAAHALHGLVDAVAIGAKPGFVVWAFAGLIVGVRYRAYGWAGRRQRRRDGDAEARR